MLTRAVFALVLILAAAGAASAGETKVLAIGLTDHEIGQEELEKGAALPAPRFNSPAIAYVWTADVKKGDVVDITLVNEGTSLLSNTETLAEDRDRFLLQAGKRGVPAGGWPEGNYLASVKITRDGKTLIEQKSAPIPFE
jgi:hypothetical protein